MARLTAHIMVRNEPFVWYAVTSVYPYVDEILLWDTGSYDRYTLKDIRRLCDQDAMGKIRFKQVKIDVDETRWTQKTVAEFQAAGRGKHTKGVVRQEMIEATRTEWFMIVDGDEVHYRAGIERIAELIRKDRKPTTIAAAIPLVWYCDLATIFRENKSGRLFRTLSVRMNGKSPNELHVNRKTGAIIRKGSNEREEWNITPYAHFETLLKPWRREVPTARKQAARLALPEVMLQNPFYMERFLHEKEKGKNQCR